MNRIKLEEKGGTPMGEHKIIRLATRLEDLEAAASTVEEDIRILRQLIRTTHHELKATGRVTEVSYEALRCTT